ncbi:hypothetical protein SAURM35S_07712 [Streptomyces aurantiogriseus]
MRRCRASPWKNSASAGSTTYRVQVWALGVRSCLVRPLRPCPPCPVGGRPPTPRPAPAAVRAAARPRWTGRAGRRRLSAGCSGRRGPGPVPAVPARASRSRARRTVGLRAAAALSGGVRGEVEAPLVRVVQEQGAYVGEALGVGRGQRHRVRLLLPGPGHGVRGPAGEEGRGRAGRSPGRRLRQLAVPDALGVQEGGRKARGGVRRLRSWGPFHLFPVAGASRGRSRSCGAGIPHPLTLTPSPSPPPPHPAPAPPSPTSSNQPPVPEATASSGGGRPPCGPGGRRPRLGAGVPLHQQEQAAHPGRQAE